jgi:outer membrane protein insertion porin family
MYKTPLFLLIGSLLTSTVITSFADTPSAPATAQTSVSSQQDVRSAPVINSIQIRYLGNARNVSEEKIRANIALRVGHPLDASLMDRSLRNLNQTGLFDLYYFEQKELPDGRVDLILFVKPRLVLHEVRFIGNDEYSEKTLRKDAGVQSEAGRPLSDFTLQSDSRAISRYYKERGYNEATVEYEVIKDDFDDTEAAVVIFRVNEGPRISIDAIHFVGNHSISTSRLEDVMTTKTRGFFSWLTGTGRFKEDVFREDLVKLRDYYRDEGFLDVEIPESKVQMDYPEPDQLIITIHVDEGRRYQTGSIKIEGNTVYTTEQLMSILTLKTGEFFSPAKVDADRERIIDYYGRDGRLETRVLAERIANLETGRIDLVYHIRESEQFYVEGINIDGNLKTKSQVILRELALAPGDVFDLVRMKTSQNRLRNLRFFDEATPNQGVQLTPEATQVPNRRNLRIDVKEGRTGALTFGAGFSTVESVILFAEMTQTNFDLFNYKSNFVGAGQKFRLRLAIGDRSNQINLSFEEPWFMEQELAVGFELFREESSYISTMYNELRMGFEVYLRKRLFELVEGRLSYRLEQVDIFDVADDAPPLYKREEGTRLVSKIGFSLVRDTRNHFVTPSSGSRLELATEYAGLGGDVDYFKLEGRAAQYFKVSDYGDQIITILGRAGNLWETGNRPVPFFDRYYLGGPNSLRGFEFRHVSPMEDGEPIGGNSYFFWSLEHSIRLAEPLRFAVFYDGGFVNAKTGDFNPKHYRDNYGFGLRLFIMGAPLRMDYGIPITTGKNESDGGQFYLSFGTRF